MSKWIVSGSATEQWHWRVLFSDGHGGREPDRFPRLSNFRCSRRRSFAVTSENRDFLRAIRNRVDLDVSLYHKKRTCRKRSDSRLVILTERALPYLETSRHALGYIDLGYPLNPSWGPNFLVVSRRDL